MIEFGMESFGDNRNKLRPIVQRDDIQCPITPFPRRMSAPGIARLAAIGVRIEIGRDDGMTSQHVSTAYQLCTT
jgi:hypothetical protein